MRTDIIDKIPTIKQWLQDGQTLRYIAKQLNCKLDTLKRYLKKFNIQYSIDQGRSNRGKFGPDNFKYISAYTYLIKTEDKPSIAAYNLKDKLFNEGIKDRTCECCGLSVWLNEPIPLELHHIDGNKCNNTLENLQILCPNCHAKTDNYRGRNIESARAKRENPAGLVKLENTALLNSTASACEFDSRIPHHKSYSSIEEYNNLKANGQIDSLGRVNSLIHTDDAWQQRKDLIINSGVDLTKFGWKTKVQKVTGLTRRQVDLTVERFIDYFKNIIYCRGEELS